MVVVFLSWWSVFSLGDGFWAVCVGVVEMGFKKNKKYIKDLIIKLKWLKIKILYYYIR